MKEKMTGKEEAWERLFSKLPIKENVEQGQLFHLEAKQIKQILKAAPATSVTEPRNLAKYDHGVERPEFFKKLHLSILPTKRGSYVIGPFEAYFDLEINNIQPIHVSLPKHLLLLRKKEITSEAQALNVALVTGMIDTVMKSKNVKASLALSGRMSKDAEFDFKIMHYCRETFFDISVKRSQIEVDGSYENDEEIAIIESKSHIPKDILVRQLYYPYRTFEKIVNLRKKIVPIFFTYSKNLYQFHIYKFDDLNNYSSIRKIDQIDFILLEDDSDDDPITFNEIINITENLTIIEDDYMCGKFPQADSMARILDLIRYIKGPKTKNEIEMQQGFTGRQSAYYPDSLVYLGLAEYGVKEDQMCYKLTELGEKFNLLGYYSQVRLLAKQILSHKVFKEAFEKQLEIGITNKLNKKWLTKRILAARHDLNATTADRRASTVVSWIKWIVNQIEV